MARVDSVVCLSMFLVFRIILMKVIVDSINQSLLSGSLQKITIISHPFLDAKR
jgi:hypothetical protein